MLKNLNGSLKIFSFALVVLVFLFIGSALRLFVTNRKKKRFLLARLTSYVSKLCLWVGRIRVVVSGVENIENDQTYLIVANHMGMIDILALSYQFPSIFVTSVELKETPVVGWLADAGGCVFVERRTRQNIHAEVANIRDALLEGNHVVIFPEAKSTNGDFVHPFKKSLFVSCVQTDARVLPITINYLKVNGMAVSQANRDFVCWYGNQSFHEALWRLMTNFTTSVELLIHPSLLLRTEEDRHHVATLSHANIQSKFVSLNQQDC